MSSSIAKQRTLFLYAEMIFQMNCFNIFHPHPATVNTPLVEGQSHGLINNTDTKEFVGFSKKLTRRKIFRH
jgi:hypothetical protein